MTPNEIEQHADPAEFDEALMSATGDISAAFQLTLHQREFEISQLTQRNNFFMIFQGVLIGGLIQSQGNAPPFVNFCLCALGFVISVQQASMAAGAKYWQMRWERATRKLEIYLLETLRHKKTVFQFFTPDLNFLTKQEEAQLTALNASTQRGTIDPIVITENYIHKAVQEDLGSPKGKWFLLKWAANQLILSKPSVSRIPIYVGFALALFWLSLALSCIQFSGGVKLVPLQTPVEVKSKSETKPECQSITTPCSTVDNKPAKTETD